MYQALYRKYRPEVFADVYGQEHITKTLQNSLEAGKIFHAYLFTGTRGTGKTTCAKILAKAVCCEAPVGGEPCGKCAACLSIASGSATDINEIDAASNNGVGDIRDLKETIHFLPAALKYRVYIIDEVHMLSISAFNALLKTLEEPPAHVLFILATTEVHKLPATILSRCQRFDFKRIQPPVLCERMQQIAEKEGFVLTPDAATLIAGLADGGMRDALSLLDQCAACSKTIDATLVANVCGIAGSSQTMDLIAAIAGQDAAGAVKIIDSLYRNSVDMKKLLFELITGFRNIMIIKTVPAARELIVCTEGEFLALQNLAEQFTLSRILDHLSLLQSVGENISVSAARSDVELMIIKLCTPGLGGSVRQLQQRMDALEQRLSVLSVADASAAALSAPSVPPKAAAPAPIQPAHPAPVLETPPTPEIDPALDVPVPPLPEEPLLPPDPPVAEPIAPQSEKPAEAAAPNGAPVPLSQWPEILTIIKKSCPLMAGVLVGSRAFIGGGRLLIDSQLSQFKDLINSDPKYRNYIRNAAEQVLGVAYNLGPYKPPVEPEADAVDPLAEFAKSLNATE